MKKFIKFFLVLLVSTVLLFSCSNGSGGETPAAEDNTEKQVEAGEPDGDSEEKTPVEDGDSTGDSEEEISENNDGEENNQSTVDSETIYDVIYNDPSAGVKNIDGNVKGANFLKASKEMNLKAGIDYTVDQETKKICLTDSGYKILLGILAGEVDLLETGEAPDAVLCKDEDVPSVWNYKYRDVLSIILSPGTWKYTEIVPSGSTILDEIYAVLTIGAEDDVVTCVEAKEIRKILLNDNQIKELKGPDAIGEKNELIGNYKYDKCYCDFNKKMLVLEKVIDPTNRSKTNHNRELPLACITNPSIKVDSVDNPTKYKLDDGWNSYRYFVKM